MDSSSDSLTDLSSSDLSSIGSRSPTPPPFLSYPSPQPSQNCEPEGSSDQQQTTSRKRSRNASDDPERKKRKVEGAKPRMTERLDLHGPRDADAPDQSAQLDRLLQMLRKRRKIVVIAGAGISTSAGIPDFRSSAGLFNTLRSENKMKASGKHLFDASVYQTDSATSSFHDMVRTLSSLVKDAKPTEFHQMLATLAEEGRLLRLYTQNVDGIDTALSPLQTQVPLNVKAPWPRTIQLHGSLEKMVCSKCSHLSPFDGSLFNGPFPPPCGECITQDDIRTGHAGKRSHGIGRLRPRMVLYNEHNPDEEAIGRVVTSDLRSRPDALIVVGTSLEIPGVKRIVKEMCGVVQGRKNGLTVWINRNTPPLVPLFEDCWDLIVTGDCDSVARELSSRPANEEPKEGVRVTDSEAESARNGDVKVQVVVKSPKKMQNPMPGLITPADSPRIRPSDAPKPKITLHLKVPPGQSTKPSTKLPKSKPLSKPPSKPKAPRKTKPKDPNDHPMSKLKSSFKVTKSHSIPLQPLKIPQPDTSTIDLTLPMRPISPQSARTNGPVSVVVPLTGAEKTQTHDEIITPTKADGRLKAMSQATINPPSPPRGMENILN